MPRPETAITAHSPVCGADLDRAFQFLGKRWNGKILGALTAGPASFSVLARSVGNISDSVLSDRLGELTSAGLVKRNVTAGPPVAVAYELTASGHAVLPALVELAKWAAQNLSENDCAAARLRAQQNS